MNPKECGYLIVDGCFHDYRCVKRRKTLTVGGVDRSYNLGCVGDSCPDFTPKDNKNENDNERTENRSDN